MSENIFLQVSAHDARQRLDVFLSQKLEQVSRSAIQRWIELGHVTVEGERRKANYVLKQGQQITVVPPPPEPVELVAEPIPVKIVYEDDVLVVVDKPAGMVVHPGAGNRRGTLANALFHHFREISRVDTIRPGIVHRLDKATSGLLVVAKNDHAHDFLSRQFKARQVEKRYLTLVHGRLKEKEGVVDVSIGRDPWARTRISTRSRRRRQALTEYHVIRYYSDFTYVRAHPHTGRTHQIRVHFQHLGHPVVGDETYGRKVAQHLKDPSLILLIKNLGRHFLHAHFLAFVHPDTKQRASFETPLPPELAEFLSGLG
ncbi:RluA family pseudouridine synthase [Acidobacteria bacterium AH-259-A15]|nr:RluA family pseudouridine synthase [Acidobacteria bacterium AH-259-A15]